MTKDEIITMLREQVGRLEADNARLREQLMDITNAVMDMVRMRTADQAEWDATQPQSGRDRTRRWRDAKRHNGDETASHGDDETSQKRHTSVTGGTIGGSTPSFLPEEPSADHRNQAKADHTPPEESRETNVTPGDAISSQCDAEWDSFWETYPRNHGSKHIAKRRFVALSVKDRGCALVGAKNYAGSRQVADGKVKYVEAWISERRWESWQEPESIQRHKNEPDYSGIDAFTDELTRMGVE